MWMMLLGVETTVDESDPLAGYDAATTVVSDALSVA
jgi:hypothetical protein